MLLNSTANTDGLIPADDVRLYRARDAEIERRFGRPSARTEGRGNTVELDLGQPTVISHAMIREDHWFDDAIVSKVRLRATEAAAPPLIRRR